MIYRKKKNVQAFHSILARLKSHDYNEIWKILILYCTRHKEAAVAARKLLVAIYYAANTKIYNFWFFPRLFSA
jgi:hypothetical protein